MRHLLQEFRGTPRADRELGTYLSAGLPVDTSTTSLEVTWDITRPGATWIVIRFWAAISMCKSSALGQRLNCWSPRHDSPGAICATREALIAAFCRLDKPLSCCWEKGWLVGAVGIENTTGRNFKDLEGMMGNAKALKRNNRECKGILIGPLMAPRFSRPPRFRHSVSHSLSKSRSRLRAQISRRGWQADVAS